MGTINDDGGDHWDFCACYDCDLLYGRCARCGGGGELPTCYVGIMATKYVSCPDCNGSGKGAPAGPDESKADSFVVL